jgi:hypothetical protein
MPRLPSITLPLSLLVSGWSIAAVDLTGQYRAPRSADYLFSADAWGVRALWVNPAGLGRVHEASVMGEFLIDRDAAGEYALGQFSVGFNSRGFGMGYRRDRFGGGVAGNVWRIGLARGIGDLSVGAAVSLYSGGNREEDLDLAIRWRPGRQPFEIGVAAEHIGQPTVRDSALRLAGVLGAAWSPVSGLIHLAVEGRATDARIGGWVGAYRAGLRLATPGRRPIAAYAVLDFDDDFGVSRLVAGFAVGGDYQGLLMGTGAKRAGSTVIETVSLTGVASHRFP